MNEGAQRVPCDLEPSLHLFETALERPILMLDGGYVVVAHRIECPKKYAPIHLAKPAEARHLPTHSGAHDPLFVETVHADFEVFGMDMENALAELVHRTRDINELPHEMRGVEVQTEILIWDDVEHSPPVCRIVGKVVAPRPFVARENHGAVFDCYPDTLIAGEMDKVGPHSCEDVEVLVD
jgi:hypothetical protein